MMRKKLVAGALAVTLLGGGAAGLAINSAEAATNGTANTAAAVPQTPPHVTAALKKLVDAKTITQAQSDAVAKALAESRPAGGPHGGPGHRPGGGPGLAAAAKVIGIDEAALREALQAGKTIAEVAQAKGVDVQKVIDALAAEANARVAQDVKDGRLTQAQADEMTSNLTERITDRVNGKAPAGRPFGPPPGGAPGDGQQPDQTAQPETASSPTA